MEVKERISKPPVSQGRDGADHSRLRHGRDRNKGFSVGQYLQPAPMLFTRDGHNAFLGDMYRGRSAFLICSGPSLKKHDLTLLDQRGILTMALNNAATVYRPHLWCSVDDPGNFSDAVWADPGVSKFVPLCHMEKRFMVRDEQNHLVPSRELVGDMPAVWGYRRNENFIAEQWLHEDSFNWGQHSRETDSYGNKGSRSVMYVALRLLFHLGIRRVYLLGCDFRMMDGKDNYAFKQERSLSSIKGNNSSYHILNSRLTYLKPYFDDAGYEVLNCTADSGLTVFPYVPFEEAVVSVLATVPSDIVTAGMYDRKQREKDKQNGRPKPVDSAPVVELLSNEADYSNSLLPEMTLVVMLDGQLASAFASTWTTWMQNKPWLRNLPLILVLSEQMNVDQLIPFEVLQREDVKLVAVSEVDSNGTLSASSCVFAVTEHVETPWYIKLDPASVALSHDAWISPEWFESDIAGHKPVIIAHRWGYTRPADALMHLDAWGDTNAGLRTYPQLDLEFDPTADRIKHPTISSWCLIGSTDWTREISQFTPRFLPCESEASYLNFIARRRGDRVLRVNLKSRGWDHSFGWDNEAIERRATQVVAPGTAK